MRYSDPVPSESGLGPAHQVTYFKGHSDRDLKVLQVLYPYALGGPVVYTPPGQAEAFFHTLGQRETSGWKRAPDELLELLAREGFSRAPSDNGFPAVVSLVTLAFGFTDEPALNWQRCVTGPWATHCPEAWWARDVAEIAGYTVIGDTGSAIQIKGKTHALHLWAYEPEHPSIRPRDLRKANYRRLMRVEGTPVYFDGIRVTWETQGMEVWLSSNLAPELRAAAPSDRNAIDGIVRASLDLLLP